MDSRTAPERAPSPEAIDFVRFCYRRRRVGWPDLYDEMCAVASRGLYRGFGSDELSALGVGFGLFELPTLASLVARVVAEDHERRARTSPAVARAPDAGIADATVSEQPVDTPAPIAAYDASPAAEPADVPAPALSFAGAAAG